MYAATSILEVVKGMVVSEWVPESGGQPSAFLACVYRVRSRVALI